MKRIVVLIFYLLCLASSLKAASLSSLPIQIKANEISYDKEKNVYIATGRVILDQGKRHLEADYVQVDMNKKQAVLKGNVLFKIGNDWIRAKKAKIDLKTYQGVLYHAQAFFAENHFYVRGEEVQKTGEDTYLIKGAEITSCDGVSPAWHFSASQVKVKLQSWASATNIVFWAKKVPLLYSPFLALPINQKRQSGFLFPYFTYSERDGTDVTLPFFGR
jgi:LPS-assembly protein